MPTAAGERQSGRPGRRRRLHRAVDRASPARARAGPRRRRGRARHLRRWPERAQRRLLRRPLGSGRSSARGSARYGPSSCSRRPSTAWRRSAPGASGTASTPGTRAAATSGSPPRRPSTTPGAAGSRPCAGWGSAIGSRSSPHRRSPSASGFRTRAAACSPPPKRPCSRPVSRVACVVSCSGRERGSSSRRRSRAWKGDRPHVPRPQAGRCAPGQSCSPAAPGSRRCRSSAGVSRYAVATSSSPRPPPSAWRRSAGRPARRSGTNAPRSTTCAPRPTGASRSARAACSPASLAASEAGSSGTRASSRRSHGNSVPCFPSFADVPLEAAWGGPIDVSGAHLPFVLRLPPGNVLCAAGYTGNGVGPTQLAGAILARLALGIEDELTRLPIVGLEPKRFPPEPIRSLGALVVNEAILRKDAAEDAGTRPHPLTGARRPPTASPRLQPRPVAEPDATRPALAPGAGPRSARPGSSPLAPAAS